MDKSPTLQRLRRLLAEQYGVSPDAISPEDSLSTLTDRYCAKVPGMEKGTFLDAMADDSLDLVEFVMTLEEELDLDIPDEAVATLFHADHTVQELADLLDRYHRP